MKGFSGIFVLFVLIATMTSGCYTSDSGKVRFGVPFIKDSFPSRYERSAEQVREAALQVLESMGQLTMNDYVNSVIEARVDTKWVTVTIQPIESGITQVITEVRSRSGLGNLDLAREIDKQIALQLPRYQTPINSRSSAAPQTQYSFPPQRPQGY